MATVEILGVERVLLEIDGLSLSEQMQVLEHLVQQVKRSVLPPVELPKRRKLSEFRGIAKSLHREEDAQEWVTRTRREGDEHRERVLRGEQ